MNKTELIEAVATRSNTSKAQTTTVLNELLEIIKEALAEGDGVQLVGFGTFSVTERESPRVFRRLFSLSQTASADSSSWR